MIATLRQYGVQYSSNSFWLGGSDLGHYGQWVWLTNGVTVQHYANWSAGSPNANDHCMAVLSNGQWINANCYEQRKFVCEST
ncbi:hypothetical protein DOY81_005149 [Sarcophaga bullata]|nr:hypothetical protein DOY81_005149 [Sarcophaga bullata]